MIDDLADNLPVEDNSPMVLVFITFGLIVYPSVTPEAFTGQRVSASDIDDNSDSEASIDLPSTLFLGLPNPLQSRRVVFGLFQNEALFVRRQTYLQQNNRINNLVGSDAVISARISGGERVMGLSDPVEIQFRKKPVCN